MLYSLSPGTLVSVSYSNATIVTTDLPQYNDNFVVKQTYPIPDAKGILAAGFNRVCLFAIPNQPPNFTCRKEQWHLYYLAIKWRPMHCPPILPSSMRLLTHLKPRILFITSEFLAALTLLAKKIRKLLAFTPKTAMFALSD